MIRRMWSAEKEVKPRATSPPSWSTHWTRPPCSKDPLTSLIPAGSRLLFPSTTALTAPSSRTRVPLIPAEYAIQCFLDASLSLAGRKRVPAGSAFRIRVRFPGVRPSAITVGIPIRAVLLAAITLLDIPPEPESPGPPAMPKIFSSTSSTTSMRRPSPSLGSLS